MSRRSNTDTRRAQIISALLPVIAQHGYEKATIQAIAQQAGLAPGLIHYHFARKQDILIALVTAIAEHADARYQAAIAELDAPADRLRAYIDSRLALSDATDADLVAAWVMIGAEAVRQGEVREVYQQAIATELKTLRELIAESLRAQGRATKPAARLAAGLSAFMAGAFQLASAARDVMPKGYAAQTAWEFVWSRIEAAPSKGRRTS